MSWEWLQFLLFVNLSSTNQIISVLSLRLTKSMVCLHHYKSCSRPRPVQLFIFRSHDSFLRLIELSLVFSDMECGIYCHWLYIRRRQLYPPLWHLGGHGLYLAVWGLLHWCVVQEISSIFRYHHISKASILFIDRPYVALKVRSALVVKKFYQLHRNLVQSWAFSYFQFLNLLESLNLREIRHWTFV